MYPLCIKLIGLTQFIYLLAYFCSVSCPHFALGSHMISSNTFCRAIYLSLVPRQTMPSCARLGPWPVAPSPSAPPLAIGPSCSSGLRPSTLCSQRPRCPSPITRPHLLPASLQIIYSIRGDKKSRKRESAGDTRDDKI